MPKAKKLQKADEARYKELRDIVQGMYRETPVWTTADLDREAQLRWEALHGSIGDERIKRSGRLSFANLVDHVKAVMTRYKETVTYTLLGTEVRMRHRVHMTIKDDRGERQYTIAEQPQLVADALVGIANQIQKDREA